MRNPIRLLIVLSLLTVAWVPAATFAAGSPTKIIQENRLTAEDADSWSAYGTAVDIAQDWAVVGAPLDNDQGIDAGAVYLYERDGPDWVEIAKLTAPDGGEQSHFGATVDLDGDMLAIGAPLDDGWCTVDSESSYECDAGAVYTYRYNGFTWQPAGKIVAEDADVDDHFGAAISLDGDSLLVGAPGKDTDGPGAGAAYIYTFASNAWTGEEIEPTDRSRWDAFGSSVALDGDQAAIGAPRLDVPCTIDLPCNPDDKKDCGHQLHCDAGAVHVFTPGPHRWEVQALLIDPVAGQCDLLGQSVDLLGDVLAAGAPHDAPGCPDSEQADERGEVLVFEGANDTWTGTARLGGDTDKDDGFGRALELAPGLLFVASPRDRAEGTVRIFEQTPTSWTHQRFLTAQQVGTGDAYGTSIAVDGPAFIVGAPHDNAGAGTWEGSAYVLGYDQEGDGLTTAQENELGSDDLKLDTDGDGLTDPDEAFIHRTSPALTDTDADGLDDPTEVNGDTDALDPDTDDDRLIDGDEVNTYGSDPTSVHSDDDDLEDGVEVLKYGTDPTLTDTDGDQLDDGMEAEGLGTDPNDPNDPLPLGSI